MYDYIIVGQGIAGTILAHTFLESSKKIYIINQTSAKSPSIIAAGIFNPITGKRIIKTWKADIIFPFLNDFYSRLEEKLDTMLLYKMPIYKPFASIAEQNYKLSEQRSKDDFYNITTSDTYNNYIHNEHGGFHIKGSGFVHVKNLLESSRDYFMKSSIYYEGDFQYHDLVLNNHSVEWKGLKAKKIIFCEGPKSTGNPFFNWLPFVLTKGEIINIYIRDFPENVIFNKSVFILPQGKSLFRVGSTYEWNYLNDEISDTGKELLKSKLETIIKMEYEIKGQDSSIRPTVKDRRPILGDHPQFKTLGIFNGLGTKGISLAPYFARHFLDFLEGGKELDPEVAIDRFYSLQ